jgi:hypothetical protein
MKNVETPSKCVKNMLGIDEDSEVVRTILMSDCRSEGEREDNASVRNVCGGGGSNREWFIVA